MFTADRARWTVPNVLRHAVDTRPDAPFVSSIGEGPCTRAQMVAAALRLAAGLQALGVQRHEAVLVMSPTCLDAVRAWLGIACAGAVEVNINGAYRGASLEHAVNLSGASVIFVEARHLPELAASESRLERLRTAVVFRLPDCPDTPAPRFERIRLVELATLAAHAPLAAPLDVEPSDIASMIYTSGTSGPAKAVRMPHAQLAFLARRTAQMLRLHEDDVFYCCHPLFHMAGKFMGILATLIGGGTIVLDRGFQAERWLDRIREHGATVGLAHGPMVEMIHAQPPRPDDADHRVRRMLMVPFPKGIAHDFERRFNLRGIECWGMTEINAVCWSPYDAPLRPGSCGRVDDAWYEFRVVDARTDEEVPRGTVGEFVVRPKVPWIIMQGYHGMPDRTLEAWRNLWFHTGDSGYLDDDGWVHFVDRLGDRIRRRAENIASYDIESAANRHPDVLECAAIGVTSEFEGDDDVKLCVVFKPGRGVAPIDLLRHMAAVLPHYMVPRYVEVLDALPRTPTNKVQKARLRTSPGPSVWDRKAANVSLRDLVPDASRPTRPA